jgi:hypothetical protein
LSGDRLISTQSIPNQPSAHPGAANAREPIPRASWEYGCSISAMVSTFVDDEKEESRESFVQSVGGRDLAHILAFT